MPQTDYFTQTQQGESRWWSWGCVFWLMLITWIVGQLAFTSPFGSIASDVDPELGNAFMAESLNMFADQAALAKFALYGLGFMITAFIGLLFFFLSYFNKGQAQKVLGVIAGVGMALSTAFMILIAPMASGGPEFTELLNRLLGQSPMAYMLMLLTFPAALVGLYLGYKFVHKRTITALHTAFSNFRWKRAVQAFFIMWAVLAATGYLAHQFLGADIKFVFDKTRFFQYAIVSLALLPIQSATEEIVFRGYMNQGLTHLLRNKWVAFVITSVLFMAMHLANPEARAGAESGILPIVMSGYFFFGFAACLMVLIDDGLESAIGVHAGNNTFAALFVNYENSVLPTPSVFVTQADPVKDSISTIVILSIVLVILYYTSHRRQVPNRP